MNYLKTTKPILIISLILLFTGNARAGGVDTCTVNDDCTNAIIITNVISDVAPVCIQGCNEYASPELIENACNIQDFPTVWYELNVDATGTLLNIEVGSQEFQSPTISLFQSISGCNNMIPVGLTNSGLQCIVGTGGIAKAIGTPVGSSTKYYIAISSLNSIGGDFEMCVSTITDGSHCVEDRDLQVIARSHPGPLEGPFNPGETVSICMNVNEYTPIGNGCQWFQGIVPVFGNGWDPISFDANGQPLNAKMNGFALGEAKNGVYGSTTWEWFNDMAYHHTNPRLNVIDLDNNGRFELCNSDYELNCNGLTGLLGGCCGPCWQEEMGTLLPGGWFAYGINGTCDSIGHPSVDWGDGNSCGSNMGPWSFCFDLVTRETPDCLGDSTRQDLTIGFHTFADGEIGAWTGSESVCAFDQPLVLTLNALCGRVTPYQDEYLPTLNSEDIFTYIVDDRMAVSYWEWNISPFHAMPHVINTGENGYIIQNQVFNNTGEPLLVKMIFIGHEEGSNDIILKKVFFTINPWTTGTTPPYDTKSLGVFPNPTNNKALIEWPKGIGEVKYLTVTNIQGTVIEQVSIAADNSNTYPLDLARYSSGLYFINLVTQQKLYSAKLIKN